jgi:cytochrome c oxidase subunit 2
VSISEDVIHSLYIPAFRIKRDVLPGRYSAIWFQATRTGEFHLFCAKYCGTNHSRMIGTVVVMEPAAYEGWLSGDHGHESPAESGRRLFEERKCGSCHMPQNGPVRCPPLFNLYAHKVVLSDDQVVSADEDYLRESILRPNAKIVKGYQALMPSFDGQLNEEEIIQLIAYMKSLSTP